MSHRVAPGLGSGTLERIIPVGQRCGRDGVTVTVLSLERHRDGFVLHARADWIGPVTGGPRLVWRVDDGHGTAFTPANCGGGGSRPGDDSTDPGPQSWRLHCLVAPAVAPDATTLTLELAAFKLREPIREDPNAMHGRLAGWKALHDLENLGRITVDLR